MPSLPQPTASPPRPRAAERWLILASGAAYSSEAVLFMAITLMALTHGPSGAAIALVAQALPRAVLLPWGGTLVDRVGPTIVLQRAAVARVVILVALALAVTLAGIPSLWLLAAFGGVLGMVDGAAYPAAFAASPAVVEDDRLARTNAVIGGAESIGDLLGPAVAAALYAWTGAAVVLWLVVGLGLVSAAAADRLHRVAPVAPAHGAARPRFVDGLRLARRDTEVWRLLVVLAAISLLLAGPVLVGGAVLAEERLGGADKLGLLLGGFGAGSLVGLLLAPWLSRRSIPLVIGGGASTMGATMVGLGLTDHVLPAGSLIVVMGIAFSALMIVLETWLQQRTPEASRGRIMAIMAFALLALDPLSFALAGLLLPLGTTLTFVLPGVATVAVGAWALTTRPRGPEPDAEPAPTVDGPVEAPASRPQSAGT
ncbi:MAG: MFS transporter [Acidimicrobiales bacterium]|nr:MFS transporter [Acidimicrobiales bacterium]